MIDLYIRSSIHAIYFNDSGIGKRYYYPTEPIEFRLFMGSSTDIQCDKSYLGQTP